MTFLEKSFGERNKIEKPTVFPTTYEKLYDDEVKTVLGNNEINDNN